MLLALLNESALRWAAVTRTVMLFHYLLRAMLPDGFHRPQLNLCCPVLMFRVKDGMNYEGQTLFFSARSAYKEVSNLVTTKDKFRCSVRIVCVKRP